MSEAGEHLELLKNAVRQSIAALTAVETDTVYQAKELAKMLQAEIGERPNETLSLSVDAGASQLLYQARRISENWADEEGVLFIIDDGGKDEGKRYPFWMEMNGLRESWAALNCHIIFFLLPHNYRMLLQVADHLADWMSLRLHIISQSDNILSREGFAEQDTFYWDYMKRELSPQVAKQQLLTLERQLTEALKEDIDPSVLVQRYYFPMFDAAVALHYLQRSENLRQKISKEYMTERDLPKWLYLNLCLDLELHQFDAAEIWANELLQWANENDNWKIKSAAFHSLGKIAKEQHDFEKSEEWHKKSMEINEQNGDKYNVAISYHELGNVANFKGDFKRAEELYQKSLRIKETVESIGAISFAVTHHILGLVAFKQRHFEEAEIWYRKALTCFEKEGSVFRVARVFYRLAIIMQEKHDFEEAEKLYKKALALFEKQENEHWSSRSYHHLGILARLQERLESSGEWLIKSIKAFENTNDPENAAKAKEEFQKTYAQASPDVQVKLKEMWGGAGLRND